MKAFIDTSTLFKKYAEEEGSQDFDQILNKISEVIVSPISWVEANSIISRLLKEKKLEKNEAEWIQREMKRDFNFYSKIIWNDNLEAKAVELGNKFFLKTLDSIQLASGYLSRADLFITSDRKLFHEAGKIFKHVQFIGSK